MKLIIIDETAIPDSDLITAKLSVDDYLPRLAPWGFDKVEVSTTHFKGNASKSKDFDVYDVKVYITYREAKIGIAGYHSSENGKPVAYVKPGTPRNRFGYYHPARVWRGKQVWAESMKLGMVGVLVHEVAEILSNPLRKSYSAPDSQGRKWYREIADWVHGNEYMKVINGKNVVFPDCALPNFNVIGATTDLSIKGNLTKSFTLTPKGYGYWFDPKVNHLVKL